MTTASRFLFLALALLLASLTALIRTDAKPGQTPSLTRRQMIHAAIADHTLIPYSSDSLDVWDVVSQADEDPAARGHQVLGIYDNFSWPWISADNGTWNREHLWPRSFGVGDPSSSASACSFSANDLQLTHPGRDRTVRNRPTAGKPWVGSVVKGEIRSWHPLAPRTAHGVDWHSHPPHPRGLGLAHRSRGGAGRS